MIPFNEFNDLQDELRREALIVFHNMTRFIKKKAVCLTCRTILNPFCIPASEASEK